MTPRRDFRTAGRPPTAAQSPVAFRAERLSPPLGEHWILYLTSGDRAVDIRHIAPEPIASAARTDDGTLGLLFPASTTHVVVEVGAGPSHSTEWQFWLNDADEDDDAGVLH